jgi:hypothetical protein
MFYGLWQPDYVELFECFCMPADLLKSSGKLDMELI